MSSTAPQHVDVEQQTTGGEADAFIHYDHVGHGSTPAAWALCATVVLGSLLIGLSLIAESWVMAWIGIALIPVALIIGMVMKRMGYGVEMDSEAVLRRGDDPRSHRGPATTHLDS
ncbi:MAG: HGxxPAAW family protein [Nesterenkonia sp.]|uniref:HGxxPAAW family protein n=1 Tax=Nesterenkonia marinintestina TaxID=2979865 RepID=UPI0021C05C12|nr:HGxxPAAW family protein [Nesterenkonia sp. GX14115]MDO5492701.1 HGxxPAAW family protein [Nesterenkonia sp.]